MKNNANRCKECERQHKDAVEKTDLANRPTQVFGEIEFKAIKSSLNNDGDKVKKHGKK